MKKIGLCLGGGGARGICHIEFLKVLDEFDLKPVMISGSSIGAIIGSFYASGLTGRDIEAILDDLSIRDIPKMLDFSFLNFNSLVKGKGVEKFLKKQLPVTRFSELKIPIKIVATDYWKEELVVFDQGDLIKAIRASISIPAIFEPVVIDGRVLIDGGVTNNLPYDLLLPECNFLIAIDASGFTSEPDKPKIPNWFDSVMNTFTILQNSILSYQMKNRRPDIYIKPQIKDIGLLEFDKVSTIIELVQDDVIKFRQELQEKLKLKTSQNQ
ncbi:MAG: patatin-like phospholipase family protein [Candidatus Cloacimonetes bacterium]|nr:patatin-like phospholipase family protein [Candidatus Cloacimonadota bacterium]